MRAREIVSQRLTLRHAAGAALLLALLAAAPTARADDHDPKRAAHPVRIVAYALHPVGVLLD
ncbi:MAG TPA: hypothetical protein VLC53_02490, partial [Myxococcota bacterium]|nr:hypothetical protein [Myxococcota bacterium]